MAENSRDIEKVADALGDLKDRCFLAGGASIPFYLTDKLEEHPRVTLDIDIVIEVVSANDYRTNVEGRMRGKGFANDTTEGAPICRWKLGPITVDLMPTDASILGFTNKWYRVGIPSLIPVQSPNLARGAFYRHLSCWRRNVRHFPIEALPIRLPAPIWRTS